MHQGGEVVNALKLSRTTIVKWFFFFINAESNICISQVSFASADELQLLSD